MIPRNHFSTLLLYCLLFTWGCTSNKSAPTIQSILVPTTTPSGQPFLYSIPTGGVLLSWVETDSNGLAKLKSAEYVQGQWGSAAIHATGDNWFVNWADFPSAVAHPMGGKLAHYLEKSSPSTYAYDIKLVAHLDNETFGTTLHDDSTTTEHGFVSIAPFGDHYFASWLDGRNTSSGAEHDHTSHDHHAGGPMSLRGAIVNRTGSKVDEWLLDDMVCDCCQTSVATTSDGILVAYRDRSPDEIRDISIVKYASGKWSDPKSINDDNWKIAGCPVNGPKVVANGDLVAVAWFTATNDEPKVQLKFSKDGGETFGEAIAINESAAIGRVGLVMDQQGNAYVSWMESGNGAGQLMLKKINIDGLAQPAIRLGEIGSGRASGVPQIAWYSGDEIIFAWTGEIDGVKQIKAGILQLH